MASCRKRNTTSREAPGSSFCRSSRPGPHTSTGASVANVIPLNARLDQLISTGEQAGVKQEVLVLAGYIQGDRHIIYGDKRRAVKNHNLLPLLDSNGSLFSILNIYNAYSSVNHRRQRAWCRERSLDFQSLQNITEYESKSVSKFSQTENPTEDKYKKLSRVIFKTFPENICIYLGHKSLGYSRLNSSNSVIVDNLLCNGSNTGTFILELPKESVNAKYAKNFVTLDDSIVTRYLYPDKLDTSLKVLMKRTVVMTVLDNVRSDILRQFDHYGKRDDCHITKSVNKITKDFKTVIEPDHDTKQLKIYGARHLVDEIRRCVLKIIEKMVEQREEHRQVVHYPTEDSNTSLLMGPGLEVKHVLMPGDVIEVLVIKQYMKIKSHVSVDLIRKVFSEFGEVEFVKEFNDDEKRRFGVYKNEKYTWGKVRFIDPRSVNKAIEGCICYDFKHPFYAKSIPRNRYKLKEGLVFTLRVCRRPYSGSVEVEYKRTSQTPKTLTNNIKIDDEEIYIYATYGKKQVLDVSYVPKIDDEILKASIEEQMKVNVTKLTRLRMSPHPATPETYQSFKTLIDHAMTKKCKIADHSVTVSSIKQDDIDMEAHLTVPYGTDMQSFLSDLGNIQYQSWMEEEYIAIDANVGMSIFVPREIWHATKEELDTVRKATMERYQDSEMKFVDSMLSNGDHSLYVSSESIERTKVIYKGFQKVLGPQVLKGLNEKDIRYMESRDGKLYMGVNMRRFGVHMVVQPDKGQLNIYGPQSAAKDALESMSSLVEGPQSEANSTYIIDVNSFNIRNGNFNDHIRFLEESKDILDQIYGVNKLTFAKGSPVITLKGSPHSYVMTKRSIGSLLKKKFGFDNSDSQDICNACFCRPVSPLYNLTRCGHVYCMMCIKSYLSIAAENKKFPIKCINESCNEPVSWQDAQYLLKCDKAALQNIITASVELYVVRNPEVIKCCSTPDCRSIYGCASETRPFQCPLCEATWCMHCHKPYHGGMPCIMEDLLANNSVDPTVVEWIRENPENRKMCAKCKSGIEKIDGCNHIHCTNCKSSVCWVCLKCFDGDSNECYDHLAMVHGGISDPGDIFF